MIFTYPLYYSPDPPLRKPDVKKTGVVKWPGGLKKKAGHGLEP